MTAQFGTDGLRGTAGLFPIVPEFMVRLGRVVPQVFGTLTHRPRVLVGKDTRLSGYMIESALTAGLTMAGAEVLLTGPLPTPALALLVKSLRCDAGIMITASHNPYTDNGVKLFNRDGDKPSDEQEKALEGLLAGDACKVDGLPYLPGVVRRASGAHERYIEILKAGLPAGVRFDGLRVCVDAAHGAGYRVLPQVLRELGAEVLQKIGCDPDGQNINVGCGSEHPEALLQAVQTTGADVGIAVDGDGDRVVLCDAQGWLDGDFLLGFLAEVLDARVVVGTLMTNGALADYLQARGRKLVRAPVGDRHVRMQMRAEGAILGGEPSGHILLGTSGPGDGIAAALQVLAACLQRRVNIAVCRAYTPYPQLLRSLPLGAQVPAEARLAAAEAAALRAGAVRASVRRSGTQPLVRIMTEARDDTTTEQAYQAAMAEIA